MAHDSFISEARLRGIPLASEPQYPTSKARQNSKNMSLITRRKPYIHEQRGFLPPLSLASILGIILFFAYIGSAVLSALPIGKSTLKSFSGVGALYTSSEEAAYCAAEQPEYDSCFSPATPTNRTIYMQPWAEIFPQQITFKILVNFFSLLARSPFSFQISPLLLQVRRFRQPSPRSRICPYSSSRSQRQRRYRLDR